MRTTRRIREYGQFQVKQVKDHNDPKNTNKLGIEQWKQFTRTKTSNKISVSCSEHTSKCTVPLGINLSILNNAYGMKEVLIDENS